MTGRLHEKVAIITGAGSVGPGWGNGRAAAALFAREGARVFAVDIAEEALAATMRTIQAEGGRAESFTCDVCDGEQVAAMVAACRRVHGRIDILVNNVGGSRAGGPVELDERDWTAQLDANSPARI
jgi:NAD(P)-dependent dehydrogenase (short-subunit alcohol dehydrogenase family)